MSYKADFLIVGSGFAGATFARMAADNGMSSLIIDRRDHIGGNCYSYTDDETGIEVHKYGPHIFHTNSLEIWNFVNRFSAFNNYIHRVKAFTNNSIYSLPINLDTINQYFRKSFNPSEALKFIESLQIKCKNISNLEEYVLNALGHELYEAFYKYYTIKQWGCDPKEINVSTAKRLPIRFYYDDKYFDDIYQGIPIEGYTRLFERMLESKLIKVALNSDFKDEYFDWREKYKMLVYTGSIDEFYNYSYGFLPYRTIRFERIVDKEIQGIAQLNYTDKVNTFTRVTEYKWFLPDINKISSIAMREYPEATDSRVEPYYPIRNIVNEKIYKAYEEHSYTEKSVIFLGRLAEYRYYDMHQVIGSSIARFKKLFQND